MKVTCPMEGKVYSAKKAFKRIPLSATCPIDGKMFSVIKSFYELDQVHCAMCMTHQMRHKNRKYQVGPTVCYEMKNYKVFPVGT